MFKQPYLFISIFFLLSANLWAGIGHVSLLKGSADAQREHQTIALKTGSELEKNDVITTRSDTQIQLMFEDKTVITLGSNSALNIQEYVNGEQNPKAKFKFTQGTFKSITGQIGKTAPQNFNLETKTATIGIRGTTVVGKVGEGDAPDTIGCLSGKIVVNNPLGEVTVLPGHFTRVSLSTAPTTPALLQPDTIPPFHEASTLNTSSKPTQAKEELTTDSLKAETVPTRVLASTEKVVQTSQETSVASDVLLKADSAEETSDVVLSSSNFYPTFAPRLNVASKNAGTVALSGYATSSYINSDYQTVSNIDNTFALVINSKDDSLANSYILLNGENDSTTLDLSKSSDASTMTYRTLNRFSMKDFDNYKGWIVTKNSYKNDYVSWGYWAVQTNNDNVLLATTNYWVAGVNADKADARIQKLIAKNKTTSYAYKGHVLGTVSDGRSSYDIDDSTNNAVKLNFDFGGGAGSLKEGSYIQFQTKESTPQLWKISPSGTLTSGSFSAQNSANVALNGVNDATSSSTINGTFYGANTKGVGGTFSAFADNKTATGVFKATR
jgi:hypothetical protein